MLFTLNLVCFSTFKFIFHFQFDCVLSLTLVRRSAITRSVRTSSARRFDRFFGLRRASQSAIILRKFREALSFTKISLVGFSLPVSVEAKDWSFALDLFALAGDESGVKRSPVYFDVVPCYSLVSFSSSPVPPPLVPTCLSRHQFRGAHSFRKNQSAVHSSFRSVWLAIRRGESLVICSRFGFAWREGINFA